MSVGSRNPPGWDCHAHVFDAAAAAVPGHYAPPERPLAMLEAVAARHTISHIVLVQPSVYATDNSVMLSALRANPGPHRGVVVIDAGVTDAELRDMHELGVRGVRFNMVSPVGNGADMLDALAPRLRDIGWHVQWYVAPEHLASVAALQARHRLVFVLDHVAGLTPAAARDPGSWSSLERVAGAGGWVKLSAWYRLGAVAPYVDLDDVVARAYRLFGSHCVFGSDWPHTWFLSEKSDTRPPEYGDLLHALDRALGDDATRVLRENPTRLYA